jgi:hypothetical protein
MKARVAEITRRNRGATVETVLKELKNDLTSWMTYYQLIHSNWLLKGWDGWIRRQVRCYRLKQTRGGKRLRRFLIKPGVPVQPARLLASSGRG